MKNTIITLVASCIVLFINSIVNPDNIYTTPSAVLGLLLFAFGFITFIIAWFNLKVAHMINSTEYWIVNSLIAVIGICLLFI